MAQQPQERRSLAPGGWVAAAILGAAGLPGAAACLLSIDESRVAPKADAGTDAGLPPDPPCPMSGALIDVTSFGAVVDDTKDDGAAITQAIAASSDGDTIRFAAGTYDVSDLITFKNHRRYLGPGAVLKAHLASDTFLGSTEHNSVEEVCIDGLTFDGRGFRVWIDTSGVSDHWLTFARCTVRSIDDPMYPFGCGFYAPGGLSSSLLTGNTFADIAAPAGGPILIEDHADGVTIASNTLSNVEHGIELHGASGVTIADNSATGLRGATISVVAGPGSSGLHVDHNQLSGWSDPGGASGIAVSASGAPDVQITQNRIEAAAGSGYGDGIAVDGDAPLVKNNEVRGPFARGIVVSGSNADVEGNLVCGGAPGQGVTTADAGSFTGSNTISATCP